MQILIADSWRLRAVVAAVLLLLGFLCGACSTAALPTAPTPAPTTASVPAAMPAPTSAPDAEVTVTVLQRGSAAPLPGATVTLSGARFSSVRTVDSRGIAWLPAIIGDSIVVTAAADGYVPFTAAAILSNGHERWTFYLERQVQ